MVGTKLLNTSFYLLFIRQNRSLMIINIWMFYNILHLIKLLFCWAEWGASVSCFHIGMSATTSSLEQLIAELGDAWLQSSEEVSSRSQGRSQVQTFPHVRQIGEGASEIALQVQPISVHIMVIGGGEGEEINHSLGEDSDQAAIGLTQFRGEDVRDNPGGYSDWAVLDLAQGEEDQCAQVVTATEHTDPLGSGVGWEGGWAAQFRWEQRLILSGSFLVLVGPWCLVKDGEPVAAQ
jgi:hypothetical protein